MKKFVVVGDGNKKGQIGKQIHDLYGGAAVDIEFDDGYVLSCMLSDLRELDDSPIAAGDEVVCVDAKIRSGATGEHSGIKLGASYFPDFVSETGIYFGTSGWDKDRFVKVKPIAPEVKQEAVEPERPDPNETLIKQIRQRLNVEQDRNRSYRGTDDILKVLDSVLEHKHSKVVDTINSARLFQEDVLSFLRAFSLILETIGDGHTHREKEARLRGLICLVETAAKRLRERQMSDLEGLSYRMLDDVFRSDFPVRHYVDKARESEVRATAAEKWLGAVKGVLTVEQVASLEKEQGSDVPF